MHDTSEIIRFLMTDPGSDSSDMPANKTRATESDVKVHETHVSVVVLAGRHAYKLKRAVKLPYLDFSSPDQRLIICQRELELNRRTAPDLYLGVRRITRHADGRLELDGDGEFIDAVVQMRRFPDNGLLADMARHHRLNVPLMSQLACSLAQFHNSAAVSPDSMGAKRMTAILDLNEQSQDATATILGSERPVTLNTVLRQTLEQHSALLDLRARTGKVRLCHGDLHLGNICVWGGKAVPFDCLEFNESMATTDVLYDLAFLLMDLWRYQEHKLANTVMNRYLDETDDIAGLPLLPYFIAQRAAIRAQVLATQVATATPEAAAQHILQANHFLDLGFKVLQPRKPQLIAIGGLSGTGKSTVASELADSIGPIPGARILSSDRLRKRLAGVTAETTLPASSYTPESSRRVYDEQRAQSGRVLTTGHAVIADAVFLHTSERHAIEKCATERKIPFTGVWLQAPSETLIKRVQSRKNDPSDATADVIHQQLEHHLGDIDWHTIQSDNPLATILAQLRKLTNNEAQ